MGIYKSSIDHLRIEAGSLVELENSDTRGILLGLGLGSFSSELRRIRVVADPDMIEAVTSEQTLTLNVTDSSGKPVSGEAIRVSAIGPLSLIGPDRMTTDMFGKINVALRVIHPIDPKSGEVAGLIVSSGGASRGVAIRFRDG